MSETGAMDDLGSEQDRPTENAEAGRQRSMDEKFCFACGTLIHVTATTCPRCGAAQTANPQRAVALTGPSLPALGQPHLSPLDQVYCRGCGQPIHRDARTCPHCGALQTAVAGRYGRRVPKSKTTAGILAIFLGGIGIHKFYLEEPGLGILYLLLSWTFIPALIGLIEGVIYLTMTQDHFSKRYG